MNGTFPKYAAAALFLAATYSVVRPAISHELKSSFRISSEQSRHGKVEQPWSYFSFPIKRSTFHKLPAVTELHRTCTQGALCIDPLFACHVHEGKE